MQSAEQQFGQYHKLWEQLMPRSIIAIFRRHSFIYTPSQPPRSLYLLQSGQISLQLLSSSGRVLTLKVIEPGQIFGHIVLTGSATYDTFAEAVKTSCVIEAPREALHQALLQQADLRLAMIEALGQYQMMVSRRLEEVAFKSVPARLASLLLDMADSADGHQRSRLPRRTHQQLAEMINAYRETVTKVINQFRAARLLDIDHSGITLLNPSRLRELAQSG